MVVWYWGWIITTKTKKVIRDHDKDLEGVATHWVCSFASKSVCVCVRLHAHAHFELGRPFRWMQRHLPSDCLTLNSDDSATSTLASLPPSHCAQPDWTYSALPSSLSFLPISPLFFLSFSFTPHQLFLEAIALPREPLLHPPRLGPVLLFWSAFHS